MKKFLLAAFLLTTGVVSSETASAQVQQNETLGVRVPRPSQPVIESVEAIFGFPWDTWRASWWMKDGVYTLVLPYWRTRPHFRANGEYLGLY